MMTSASSANEWVAEEFSITDVLPINDIGKLLKRLLRETYDPALR
jgi:acyl-CoA synthetase (AMP-forming)/AMP-acid ligase II